MSDMNLGPEALKAVEIFARYNKKSLAAHLHEYHQMLDALVYCNEAVAESQQKFPEWWTYSDIIITKFVMHSNTLYNISLGVSLNSIHFKEFSNNKFIDIPSLKIIFRAQLEAFLMLHYIYINPKSDEEKEFRFNAWMYTSLLERTLVPSNTTLAVQRRQQDLAALQILKTDIENSHFFNHLTKSQQSTFIRKGSARLFKSWKSILSDTGFSEDSIMTRFYSLLSNYAHTEGLSVLQMKQSNYAYDDSNEQANMNVFLSKQLLCAMIISLTKLYGVVKKRFDILPDDIRFAVDIYAGMASK